MEEKPLIELSDSEIRLNFKLNSKCRANITIKSLSSTTPIAFKVQTSSPHKFLVNPPTGVIPPLSVTVIQIILKPQTHLPPTFPRSRSDRFLIRTASFNPHYNSDNDNINSLHSFFSTISHSLVSSFKLKVAFVGPFLLRQAVVSGDVDSVKNIIKRQRSILAEFAPIEAESLLRLATELDDPENMVNLLLEAGLKIDSRVGVDNGRSNNNVGFYEKWESKGWSELHVAVAFDRTGEVLNLVERLGTLDLRDKEGRTPLHLAVSRGNVRCAKVLIEYGGDKDAKSKDGRTVLYRAAANGDRKMAEMLIEMGADPTVCDDRGRSAFDVARDKGHEEIVEIMEQGELVLMAARKGDSKLLQSLLHKGANATYTDQYGLTPLHAGAIKGHKKIVSTLIESGVNVEIQDNEGHVPLHLAVEGGSLETVEVLVNKGANLNARTNHGATPVYLAKAMGCDDILEFLVNRGASFSHSPSPIAHSL
ncbi:protein VAPYRIN-like [Mercurialis annua]|uniref:protein VAPYRIN-like n=1 Tax=Mercurialis annua TaxID=3986 RepID=UPI00216089F7|nr:protein VAPYRIN-like [Mercurialis annua]